MRGIVRTVFLSEKIIKRKCRLAGMALGFLFSAILIIGEAVEKEVWRDSFWIQFSVWGCIWGELFSIFYQVMEKTAQGFRNRSGEKSYRFWPVYLLLTLCYLPCFLAYFPGCMSYDAGYITWQTLRIIPFNNHHPFFHTLVWSLFLYLEQLLQIEQIGIVLYTSVQLLIITGIDAYVIVWISGRKGERFSTKAAFLYYAVNPVFHIFALIMTKDVLFSGFFLLFSIALTDFFENEVTTDKKEDEKQQKKVMALGLLCCLFRNNMIYVLLLFLLILLLVFRMKVSRFRGLLFAVLAYYFVTKIIYPGMGVAEGERKEMLSVPMSQLAAVYREHSGELEEEDRERIKKYIPDVESYDRFFADMIKARFNENAYREDAGEFLSLWSRLLMIYPKEYSKAFLALNLPYWYPPKDSVREYIETENCSQEYPAARADLLPSVFRWYEKVAENQFGWMHLPVLRQIFSIGTPVWILLFFGIWSAINKKKAAVLAMIPSFLLWFTYLLGPVSNFRYIEPLMLTYPVWLKISLEGERSR